MLTVSPSAPSSDILKLITPKQNSVYWNFLACRSSSRHCSSIRNQNSLLIVISQVLLMMLSQHNCRLFPPWVNFPARNLSRSWTGSTNHYWWYIWFFYESLQTKILKIVLHIVIITTIYINISEDWSKSLRATEAIHLIISSRRMRTRMSNVCVCSLKTNSDFFTDLVSISLKRKVIQFVSFNFK